MNSHLAGVVTALFSALVEDTSSDWGVWAFVGSIVTIVGILVVIAIRKKKRDENRGNIPMEALEQMFAGMKNQAGWNTDGDLLWSYFFLDPERTQLEPLAEHLGKMGYRVVSIDAPDPEEDDEHGLHRLQVDRVETHTPASLAKRNAELSALASEFGVESYDGMEAGPVPEHK
jgi:hypothetical protein